MFDQFSRFEDDHVACSPRYVCVDLCCLPV